MPYKPTTKWDRFIAERGSGNPCRRRGYRTEATCRAGGRDSICFFRYSEPPVCAMRPSARRYFAASPAERAVMFPKRTRARPARFPLPEEELEEEYEKPPAPPLQQEEQGEEYGELPPPPQEEEQEEEYEELPPPPPPQREEQEGEYEQLPPPLPPQEEEEEEPFVAPECAEASDAELVADTARVRDAVGELVETLRGQVLERLWRAAANKRAQQLATLLVTMANGLVNGTNSLGAAACLEPPLAPLGAHVARAPLARPCHTKRRAMHVHAAALDHLARNLDTALGALWARPPPHIGFGTTAALLAGRFRRLRRALGHLFRELCIPGALPPELAARSAPAPPRRPLPLA